MVAASLLFGGTGCHRASQSRGAASQYRQPLLEVDAAREPDGPLPAGVSRNNSVGYGKTPGWSPGWYGSHIEIFADGSVQYRVSAWKSCSPDCPNYGWLYRWEGSREQVFTGKIDQPAVDRLKALLEREGKSLEGYANQGPQVGDFQILIHNSNGKQSGAVVFGLQPAWGISRPYVDVICEAKAIAQRITTSAPIADWCHVAGK